MDPRRRAGGGHAGQLEDSGRLIALEKYCRTLTVRTSAWSPACARVAATPGSCSRALPMDTVREAPGPMALAPPLGSPACEPPCGVSRRLEPPAERSPRQAFRRDAGPAMLIARLPRVHGTPAVFCRDGAPLLLFCRAELQRAPQQAPQRLQVSGRATMTAMSAGGHRLRGRRRRRTPA
jgi:hypothetical protein